MLPSGHFAAGYLASTALIKIADTNLNSGQMNLIVLLGTFSAIAPDIDLIYYFIRKKQNKLKKNENHRFYPTHAPILWFVISLGIYLIGGNEFYRMVGLSVFIGSFSHFLLDSIEFGVPWLWPISKKLIAFRKMPDPSSKDQGIIRSQFEFITKTYPKMLTSFIEVLIIASALIIFLTPHLNASTNINF